MSVPIKTSDKEIRETIRGRTWRLNIMTDTAYDPHYYPIKAHQEAAYYEQPLDENGDPVGEEKHIKSVRGAIPADAGEPDENGEFPDAHGGMREVVQFDPVLLGQTVESVTYDGVTVPGTHFLPLIRAAVDAMREHFANLDKAEAIKAAKAQLGLDSSSSSEGA